MCSSPSSSSSWSCRVRSLFPPLHRRNLLSYYIPVSGAISHTLFQNHIFSPSIVHDMFPVGELAVSNVILFNANLGLGFWVYFRPHMTRADRWTRVEFAVFTSTIFNFGSLLSSVLIKALIPSSTSKTVKAVLATSLSLLLLSRAYKYSTFLDKKRIGFSKSPSPKLEGHENGNGTHTSIKAE